MSEATSHAEAVSSPEPAPIHSRRTVAIALGYGAIGAAIEGYTAAAVLHDQLPFSDHAKVMMLFGGIAIGAATYKLMPPAQASETSGG